MFFYTQNLSYTYIWNVIFMIFYIQFPSMSNFNPVYLEYYKEILNEYENFVMKYCINLLLFEYFVLPRKVYILRVINFIQKLCRNVKITPP